MGRRLTILEGCPRVPEAPHDDMLPSHVRGKELHAQKGVEKAGGGSEACCLARLCPMERTEAPP